MSTVVPRLLACTERSDLVSLDLKCFNVAVLLELDPNFLLNGKRQRRLKRAAAHAEAGALFPIIQGTVIVLALLAALRSVGKLASDELVDHEWARELDSNVRLRSRVVHGPIVCHRNAEIESRVSEVAWHALVWTRHGLLRDVALLVIVARRAQKIYAHAQLRMMGPSAGSLPHE